MKVKKRNGNLEEFDFRKIEKAVEKCFQANGHNALDTILYLRLREELHPLYSLKRFNKVIDIEDIQDGILEVLMANGYNKEAISFALYRERHKKLREFTDKKMKFIKNFAVSDNAANSTIDDNSNVASKNITVLNSEIHKEDNMEINIRIWEEKLKELYPDFDYTLLKKDINTILYAHDLSSQVGMPYCVAISMYPFLLNGIKEIGGLSAAPKSIESFCGLFINMVCNIASQFKGAVATPGLLICMDWYIRKEWGDNYFKSPDKIITAEGVKPKTIEHQIKQYFQQICYSLMQPSRAAQSIFWNVSIFDEKFFNSLYEGFAFPDGTTPKWESLKWLQQTFVTWLNMERLKCILTFPVVSVCMIHKDGEFEDTDMFDYVAEEYSKGNSFFTYISETADSLSSCCRLKNKIDKPQFSFTNGNLSEMTGSKNVITLNINRIVQDYFTFRCDNDSYIDPTNPGFYDDLPKYLEKILSRVYKYQTAYNEILKDLKGSKLLTVYDAGFIDMKKQYLTIGINGLTAAAESLGIEVSDNHAYKRFCNVIFSTIKRLNKENSNDEVRYNTELVPAESASIKLYNRDKKDGYKVPEDINLYTSYMFKPYDVSLTILDKIKLHGKEYIGEFLDGGAACHINLNEHLTKEQYKKVITTAAREGCEYFTFNVPNTECRDCGFITKIPLEECPKCKSKNLDYYDRIIGYLSKISNWSEGRQKEQKRRVYKSIL